jgi:hypothetical protein
MNTQASVGKSLFCTNLPPLSPSALKQNSGQALVEFTLIFILLLVVAWIPADFGLAFYTGQLAQNASREGARIAAAERTLTPGSTKCQMPCASATGLLKAVADRMSSALLPGAWVTLDLQGGTTCDRLVTVIISGPYNFSFYRILRFLGFDVPPSVQINRQTSMRWEHQC